MASTNKTANLRLNQWVLTDPFLMEDMNADNLAIDTAVAAAANQYVKLLDVTTAANALQVDLDVSGIDLTMYSLLHVMSRMVPDNPGGIYAFYTRINNGGSYFRYSYSSSSLTSSDIVSAVDASYDANLFSSQHIQIFGIPDTLTKPYLITVKTEASGMSDAYRVTDMLAVKQLAANTKISTISFFTNSTTVKIKAGARFEIYGVKK